MFRPFLPCGIAYGSAYALPMALPMAFHALFPAEGIPPGCLYCTISARCLSTGFGRISAAFAFFRRRGVPPCRGGLLRRCRRGGRWRRPAGAEPQRHLFTLPRGRGPSQTPPSLATDSSISPGPPLSLAAGTAQGKAFLSVLHHTVGSPDARKTAWQGL